MTYEDDSLPGLADVLNWHMDAAQYWADMDRDNDLTVDGYRVLRFPAFLVRYHPGYVARKIRAALRPGVGIQIPA